MSGYGKSRPRRKSSIPHYSPGGAGSRDVDEFGEEQAKRWAALAPVLGYCTGCGARVNEAEGKLHDEGCIPSAPERCQKGQRS